MLPYIAGSHRLAVEFVCCHFGDSFRHPPIRTRGLSCEPIRWLFPYRVHMQGNTAQFQVFLGIESRNPHVPTCCHLRTVYLPALNPIADLFNWCGPGLLLIV